MQQMEREGGKEIMMSNFNHRYSQFSNDYDRQLQQQNADDDLGGFDDYGHNFFNNVNGITTTPFKPTSGGGTSTNSSPTSSPGSRGFIEHPVSKFDTLAGVAIKYGVEVADIKKKNGLVTDHQMFALKTLRIPHPGRHPPSPCLSSGADTPGGNNLDHTPFQRGYTDLLDSFQTLRPKSSSGRKASPAMTSLQGYYGISSPADLRLSPDTNPPLNHHRKSRSYVNVLLDENNAADGDSMVRRRQKSEADFPNMLMREENGNGSASVSAGKTGGKGLALRPKSANRSGLISELEAAVASAGSLSPNKPAGAGGDPADVADLVASVRKSSSTSSLNETDGSGGSFPWPTPKWNLKADLQALSAAAIARPIFDGLPKPLSGWRNKAAVD
ncbi:unnamed protein product [Linum tenue]|uniref:LysM domain-containing protein n=1 Tax=Linum tenue TaxID=586396 RepID=A0AAV0MDI6_9ROSI|nr:unnamed protein product [Linum tenue]